jgi:transcription elongation factor Elf1
MFKCPRCGKEKFKEELIVVYEIISVIVCDSCGAVIGAYPQEQSNTLREITERLNILFDRFNIR